MKILCDDVECRFKVRVRYADKIPHQCSLDLSDAIMFLERFNITTCEAGMCEKIIGSEQLTHNIIDRLKSSGHMR